MSTIEKKVLDNQEKIKQFILPIREKIQKPFGKICGDSKKMNIYNEFNQWDQGFNQYGR